MRAKAQRCEDGLTANVALNARFDTVRTFKLKVVCPFIETRACTTGIDGELDDRMGRHVLVCVFREMLSSVKDFIAITFLLFYDWLILKVKG